MVSGNWHLILGQQLDKHLICESYQCWQCCEYA